MVNRSWKRGLFVCEGVRRSESKIVWTPCRWNRILGLRTRSRFLGISEVMSAEMRTAKRFCLICYINNNSPINLSLSQGSRRLATRVRITTSASSFLYEISFPFKPILASWKAWRWFHRFVLSTLLTRLRLADFDLRDFSRVTLKLIFETNISRRLIKRWDESGKRHECGCAQGQSADFILFLRYCWRHENVLTTKYRSVLNLTVYQALKDEICRRE